MKFILAKKLNMSSVFDEKGKIVPVTILEAGPVKITQIKNIDKDGYLAVQVGFGQKKKISKPLLGHLKDNGKLRWLKEFRAQDAKDLESYKVGDEINVSVFNEGELVNISGISRGKGFQGVVKRHGFHGKEATHGVKHAHRQPGSIGATTPQHVIKGKKMAGRTGGEKISLKRVKVVKIDKDKNLIYLKGALPGKRGTLIEIFN
jgi:large subunit ribosomal protein L3